MLLTGPEPLRRLTTGLLLQAGPVPEKPCSAWPPPALRAARSLTPAAHTHVL